MATSTVGTQRNAPFTVFNNTQDNSTSSIFALFGKPLFPHYITFLPTFPSSVTCRVDAYLGVLGPAPVQSQANTDSATMAASIVWGASAGNTSTSGTPITIKEETAQFVKFVISSYSGPSAATITNVAVTSNVATITATNTFASGDSVTIAGLTHTVLNGTWVLASASGSSFTFDITTSNIGSASDSGTATDNTGLSATAVVV